MNYKNRLFVMLSMVVVLSGCGTFASSQNSDRLLENVNSQSTEVGNSQPLDYQDYATVLSTYVNELGQVNYGQLKENRADLDRFNQSLGEVTPATYAGWTEPEQIAFWINAYNSLTLQAIIDNYPVESIRKIPGVWKSLQFPVLGEPITLDAIEHQILRKEFNEPRIHMALVCASVGCPNLLQEPYRGDTLDTQLNDNTRVFLSLDRNFSLDPDQEQVNLSSIFKWFGEDFEATYGTDNKFTEFNDKERSLLNFVGGYLDGERLAQLQKAKKISYLDYDWSLNRQ